jgi:hypothetical protein
MAAQRGGGGGWGRGCELLYGVITDFPRIILRAHPLTSDELGIVNVFAGCYLAMSCHNIVVSTRSFKSVRFNI